MKSDKIKFLYCFNSLAFLTLAAILLVGCEMPPMDTAQQGYRGTGMETVTNPTIMEKIIAANQAPPSTPPLPATGPKAGAVYQNVQVLGDLSVAQFTRLMASMTQWISPEQGCGYCHNLQNLASDEVYTKVVARSMLLMTIDTNQNWQDHVGDTGVTCYTCHRGKNIPEYVWATDPGPKHVARLTPAMQNTAAESVAYSSLPFDPFTPYLDDVDDSYPIRVISDTALPTGSRKSIKEAEWTYGLMMHMSDSLGVNCTYCHNSRAFAEWEQSPYARQNAWHAIRHVRKMNKTIWDVADILPDSRKGPLGDPLKIYCMTCHQGVNKPLLGARMLENYPSLAGKTGE
ncbi:MAG: photosynthetic reaction center cytochrome PufC [Gammaproteobacteria bacterium]|nr:photosynthetic reaction center cytochrome PufC [Gammaproteobacteria bacterium]